LKHENYYYYYYYSWRNTLRRTNNASWADHRGRNNLTHYCITLEEYILSILPAVVDEGNSSFSVQAGKRRGQREWHWENIKMKNRPLQNSDRSVVCILQTIVKRHKPKPRSWECRSILKRSFLTFWTPYFMLDHPPFSQLPGGISFLLQRGRSSTSLHNPFP